MALLLLPEVAGAALTVLQPDPADSATFSGEGGYSADGLGQAATGESVQAEVPAGSTVVQAYLYGSYHFTTGPTPEELTIDFDGTPVLLAKIADAGGFLATARADVTPQVAAKVGGGGGITDFAVNTDPARLSGVALVVIYANPSLPEVTIALLDGVASPGGDTATFTFASPLDKTVPGFSATMSLGIAHSFQGGVGGHACETTVPQYSTVSVNTALLTGCAGNYDDGLGTNGGLITVGGVGDSTGNPSPPATPPEDDELYDLEPFLLQGDTSVVVDTSNPSGDDNLFLAVIAITAQAQVTTEDCSNGVDDDGDGLIDLDDPDCAPPPVPEVCDNGIDDDGDGLVDQADPDCPAADTRRMTGGGSLAGASRSTHGFTLRCDTTTPGLPQRLQVNWGNGHRFHLTELVSVECLADSAFSEGSPVAGFNTLAGTGTGRHDGVDGAAAAWTLTDAGEPGVDDTFTITITDGSGNVVLSASGSLRSGNHQAQP